MTLKTFVHINEFGERAWQSLPALVAMSQELWLWGPSGQAIKQAFESGLSPYSPNQILEAIEAGVIKIVARENWLYGKNWRQRDPGPSDYFGVKWLDGFDDSLLRLAHASSYEGDGPVRIASDEQGWTWAQENIEARTPQYHSALRLVESRLVPIATLERLERERAKGADTARQAQIILRDSKNHLDAKHLVGANQSVEYSKYAYWKFRDLAGIEPLEVGRGTPPDVQRVQEILRTLTEMVVELAAKPDLIALAQAARAKNLSTEIQDLIYSAERVRWELAGQIRRGEKPISDVTFSDYIGADQQVFWFGLAGLAATLVGGIKVAKSVHSALGKEVNRREMLRKVGLDAITTAVGVVASAAPPVAQIARNESVISAGPDYDGPVLPFLLAYDTDAPTRNQIREVLNWLSSEVD